MARKKHRGVIKKASEFTGGKGYLVFTGSYPHMKVKHFRSKKAAMKHKHGKKF